MRVKAEACWSGGEKYHWQLTLQDGRRARVEGREWDRKVASSALDALESEFGVDRRTVRFDVH